MEKQMISLQTKFGDELKGFAWTVENPKENVIIVSGMEEKVERYDEFAKFLNSNGFNVYAIDHYGQGLNVDEKHAKGIVPKSFFSKSVKNIDEMVKTLRASLLPTTIFAHSMGSFMLQDYIQRFTDHVNKVVICGSNGKNAKLTYMFGRFIASFGGKKGKHRNDYAKMMNNLAFGGYKKAIKNRKTDFDWLSTNEENVKQYIEDPLCGYGSSKGFYYEFMKGCSRIYKREFTKKIRKDMHILIISGADDPVGAFGKGAKSLEKMYKKLHISDVQSKVYDGMRHEILNENEKEKVYADVLEFLNKEVEPAEELLKF